MITIEEFFFIQYIYILLINVQYIHVYGTSKIMRAHRTKCSSDFLKTIILLFLFATGGNVPPTEYSSPIPSGSNPTTKPANIEPEKMFKIYEPIVKSRKSQRRV